MAGVLFAAGTAGHAQSFTTSWTPTTSGLWSTGTNWNNGVPNSPNAQVTILSNITATTNITLDIAATLDRLTIGDSSNSFVILPSAPGSTLTFANNEAPGDGVDTRINKTVGGTDIIAAGILNTERLVLNVTTGTLALSGPVTISTEVLEKIGGGTVDIRGQLNLHNHNVITATGNKGLLVTAGTLNLSSPSNAIANTVKVTGGTLNFSGRAASQVVSATVSSGNSLTLTNVAGLSTGMAISGANIPVGTYITGISGTTITLSNPVSGNVTANDRLVFGGPSVGAALATGSGNSITLNSTAGISIGMNVHGANIPAGTTVIGVSGNTVTLSNPVSGGGVGANQVLNFGARLGDPVANATAHATVATAAGGNTVTLSDVSQLTVDMLVTGPGIPANTTITAINTLTKTITLSAPLPAGTSLAELSQLYFGTGQTTFASGLGELVVTGGAVNIGTAGNAVNFMIDADQIEITGGTLTLQAGNGGGVTTVLGGATNLLTLNGGTLNVLSSGTASGTVNFASAIDLVLNNNAIFNFSDNVGTIQTFAFGSVNSTSNNTSLVSSVGNAVLQIGGDGVNDVFNGTVNMGGSGGNSRIVKVGTETLTLGGTLDNSTARVEVREGTLILAKASSPTVHAIGSGGTLIVGVAGGGVETAQIGDLSSYVGLGNTHMTNYTNQIHRGATLTVNSTGVFDLNGFSEALNVIAGAGVITNNKLGTTSTILIGQNNTEFTWSGIIQDGNGQMAVWKASSTNTYFENNQTYTGETLVGRSSLVLRGANGRVSGTSTIRVSTNGQLALLNNTATDGSGNNNDRVNDSARIYLDKGGLLLIRRAANNGTTVHTIEKMGVLQIGAGFSQVRTDHTDGTGGNNNVNLSSAIEYVFADYERDQGGIVGFTEIASDGTNGPAVGFSLTNGATALSRVKFESGVSPGSMALLAGNSNTADAGDADFKVLIGAYGGTHNQAYDRLVTVGADGYIRLLNASLAADFRTQITSATTTTSSNLAASATALVAATRDNNARGAADFSLLIGPSSNVLLGEHSFNAWVQTAAAVTTISEQNTLHLGTRAADANYAGVDGSGMFLVSLPSGSFTMNGGTLSFGTREAIIRTNNTSIFRSEITGSAGLTKSGGALMELQGFNKYTGVTTVTQGELRIYTSGALGASGSGNGTKAVNGNLGMNSGVVTANDETLELLIGGNLLVIDQNNTWNGDVFINNNFETGQNNNGTIQVNDNGSLIINGRVTGMSAALGGINGDPAYTGNGESRGLIFTNGGANLSSVRNGIIKINGTITDEDFAGGAAAHQRLNLFVRGYTGQGSLTNSRFNVFLKDASQTNGQLDLRSGYLHLDKGYASAGGPGGAGVTVTVVQDAFTGGTTLVVDTTAGLTVGTVITGPGIEPGTTVAAIDGATNTITLSDPLTADVTANTSISSGAGGTFTILRQHDGGNVDRAGTISALLLSEAGAIFRSPTIQIGENTGAYSSNNIALLGGENTSGTVTFGAGTNTVDMNPITGTSGGSLTIPGATGSGATSLTLSSAANLRVGDGVSGTGIAPGTTITGINGNVITLSTPTSGNIAANGTISYGYLSTTNNAAGSPGTTKVLSLSSTGGGAAGSQVIQLSNANWLEAGMQVTGHPNIPNGATILSVNPATDEITISVDITGSGVPSGTTLSIATASGNRIVFLNSVAGLEPGMGISGTGIPTDTKIVSVNAATGAVLLSKATTAAPPAVGSNYSVYALSNTITLSTVQGLQIGMGISGNGIRIGTVITAIDPVTKTVVLSAATNGPINETTIQTVPIPAVAYNVSATAASGSNTLVLSSVAGLSIGATVSGTGVPNGTVITAINPATNTVTLSQPISAQIAAAASVNIRKVSNFSETRLYQAAGGKSDFQMRFTDDGGFSLQNEVGALTKVGRGVVTLSGSTAGASDLDGGINVHGGTLELLYGQANTNNSRVNGGTAANPYQLTLAGGELKMSALGNSSVAQTVNESFRGVFTLRAGNSSIKAGANSEFATIVLNLGLDNPFSVFISEPTSASSAIQNPDWYWRAPDRFAGATIAFDGTPLTSTTIRYLYSQNALNGNGFADNGLLGYFTSIPYATFKAGSIGNPSYVDFASFIPESTSNPNLNNTVIGDSSGLLGNVLFKDYGGGGTFASQLGSWSSYVSAAGGTEYMTDALFAGSTGFTGTLNANSGGNFYGAKLIRFAAAASSTINIAAGTRLVLGTTAPGEGVFGTAGLSVQDGGAILISNSVGANNQGIEGGELTSALLSTYYTQPLTTTTASAAGGTVGGNTLGVASVSALKVGMTVSGAGIVPGSYITDINRVTNTVTLNTGLSAAVSNGAVLEFRDLPQYHVANYFSNTNGNATAGTTTLTLQSVADLVVGMRISTDAGNLFAPGTTIIAINKATNQITLSSGTLADVNDFTGLQFDLFAAQAPSIRPANTTISLSYPAHASTFDARDLIIHNYNEQGVFTIGSRIVDFTGALDGGPSRLNLVIGGPGVTHLTNATNNYTGSTFVSGGGTDAAGNLLVGTLWIANENRLGATPGSVNPASIFLNGGRLRFDSDVSGSSLGSALTLHQNRGITLGGNGGYIDVFHAGTTLTYGGVIRSEDNIQMGNLGSNQYYGNIGSGDLIKEGNGRLILTNDNSVANLIAPISSVPFTTWNAYFGITDVKAGTLQLNIGKANSGILGSNDSTIDGTIVRAGARLDLQITGGSAHGTKEWITLAGGVLGTTALHTDGALDGVISVTANSEINVAAGNLRLNGSSGFLQGTGTITKTGTGSLMLFENNSDFSGGWVIQEGSIITRSQGRVTGQGGSILIGTSGAAAGLGTAGLYQRSRTSGGVFTTEYKITQNIVVRAESSGSQVKEIGVRNDLNEFSNVTVNTVSGSPVVTVSSVANLFTGMVTQSAIAGMPAGAIILAIDPATNRVTFNTNATSTASAAGNIGYNNSGMNNDRYSFAGTLTLNDDLQVAYRDNGTNPALTPTGTNPDGSQRTGITRIIGLDGNISGTGNLTTVVDLVGGTATVNSIFELNGENSSWVGDLTMGNAASQTRMLHTVRLGSNTALNAANAVTLRNNSTLQVAGHTVEIGDLSVSVTDGGGTVAVDNGAATRGIFIENASNDIATLIINQLGTTNWDVHFRDGTTPSIYSASTALVHSNKLNIVKRGTGVGIMTQTNTYTGTTTIENGTLRSGSSNVLPDASPIIINATGAGVTATLDLNNNNDSIASLTMGGTTTTSTPTVQTGTGTLTLLGNVTYDAANNPQGGTISGNLALGGASRTFTVGDSTTATNDLTVSAVVSSAGTGSIVKTGLGTMVLSGNNTYTGTTTVSQGRLHVGVGGGVGSRAAGDTGAAGASATTVSAGAFLSGTGTVQGTASSTAHSIQGTIQPGSWNGTTSGIGKLDIVGNLNATGGTFALQLSGNSMNDATLAGFVAGSAGYDSHVTAQLGTYEGSVTGIAGGANHDFLNISGSVTLDGNTRIQVQTEGSYTYAAGDIFDILDWTGLTAGLFDVGSITATGNARLRSGGLSGDLELPTLTGNLVWDVQKLLSDGILIVANNVPEPSRAMLFVIGFAGMLLRRRRPTRK
ncbi:beta strand repeat-containing protein [Roseimicrobium gellanilyticum]|uniref:beta strand repeat-containing protein n=1 Tax=Roseimicrobium gellanilyticum TaxID=748857 RepID=UPI000DEB356F|nr:autotransporter-associated beta strand repeat-containing protein [Roseimicrobium gellanilyticum]